MATLAEVQAKLDSYGIGFLFDLFKTKIAPDEDITGLDENKIVELIQQDPATKQAYDQRFSGNALRIANGFKALPASEYIAAEKQYTDTLRNTGLPVGFYDTKDDLAKFIGSDLSRIELENRVVGGYRAAQSADAATKASLQELYGITENDLAAYYLDPTRATDVMNRKKDAALFTRQVTSAQIAGQAQSQAGMGLTATDAEALAAQGVNMASARQGFSDIAQQRELYGTTTAEAASGETGITATEQIGAALGTNAAAAQRVAARRRKRTAAFEAGGSLAVTQQGVTGLKTVGQ
jgi:hypothetical protein